MKPAHAQRIHIGTSGWSYPHWKNRWYPLELSQDEWLRYYAGRLSTVEINASFYRLPSTQTLKAWRRRVPKGFFFSVKASRYLTHMKKLSAPARPLERFFRRVHHLGNPRGPVLFQLPPRWHRNAERLGHFLEALPAGWKYAFEFRDPSWLHQETYDLLARHGAALCIYDLNGRLSPKILTADFVYVRLHGPNGPYKGSYSTTVLAGWIGAFATWASQGKDVYCYFDNDQYAYAALNAQRMRRMVEND